MGDGSKVHDDINSPQKRAAVDFVSNILDCNPMQTGRIDGQNARAPHHGTDRVATREQPAAQSRADESGCTGNENVHERSDVSVNETITAYAELANNEARG
jgi:hypothetical protein